MGNLLFKEKLVLTLCCCISFIFFYAGFIGFFISNSSTSDLALAIGAAITIFIVGLNSKFFSLPLKSAFSETPKPIFLKPSTLNFLLISGLSLSVLGLITKYIL